MANLFEIMDPAVLTAVVREEPEPAGIALSEILPDRLITDLDAAWDDITQTNAAATFRAFDAETPIGARDNATRKSAEMLAVGEKYLLGEYDRLKLQAMQTGGDVTPLLQDAIFNDARRGANAVRIRAEVARGDVLQNGVLAINENDVNVSYDYGVPAGNLRTASATFYTTTTDIPAELDAHFAAVDNEVEQDGIMWVSRKVARYLAMNTKYQALASVGGVTPPRLSLGDINAAHDRLGFPEVRVYDSSFTVAGSSARVLPEDDIIFTPRNASDLGFTGWGVTAEALELAEASRLAFSDAPGLTGLVIQEGDPVKRWTKVTGICLPVITAPNKLSTLNVTP